MLLSVRRTAQWAAAVLAVIAADLTGCAPLALRSLTLRCVPALLPPKAGKRNWYERTVRGWKRGGRQNGPRPGLAVHVLLRQVPPLLLPLLLLLQLVYLR